MKKLYAALIALTAVTAGAQSANADGDRLAEIIFGKNYNDGVTAVAIRPGIRSESRAGSEFVIQPFPVVIASAQSTVSADPALLAALERRKIAVHNVLKVETAANGGRIIYYR